MFISSTWLTSSGLAHETNSCDALPEHLWNLWLHAHWEVCLASYVHRTMTGSNRGHQSCSVEINNIFSWHNLYAIMEKSPSTSLNLLYLVMVKAADLVLGNMEIEKEPCGCGHCNCLVFTQGVDTIKDTMYSPEPGQLFKLVSILKLLSGVRLLSLALCTNRKWSHLTLWKAVLNAKNQNILQNVFQRSDHQETIAFPCLIQTLYFDVSLFKKMFNVKVALWLNRQCQTWVVWLGVGGVVTSASPKGIQIFL